MTPTTDQLKDLLAKVTPDWRYDGMTCDDPRMIGKLLRVKTSEFHSIFVAAWLDDERDASEARSNATLIALAPTLAAEVVRLRIVADAFKELLATVEGECPSLVDEDSGASQVLLNLLWEARQALSATSEK